MGTTSSRLTLAGSAVACGHVFGKVHQMRWCPKNKKFPHMGAVAPARPRLLWWLSTSPARQGARALARAASERADAHPKRRRYLKRKRSGRSQASPAGSGSAQTRSAGTEVHVECEFIPVCVHALEPSEFLHGPSCMPDFRHVPDLLPVKIHHIHIVCLHTLARGRTGATLSRMRAREDPIGTDALPLLICAKGFQFIASVRDKGQQTLHPVRVLLQGLHASQRLSLGSKRRIRGAVRLASLPSFPRFAGLEELLGNGCNGRHGVLHVDHGWNGVADDAACSAHQASLCNCSRLPRRPATGYRTVQHSCPNEPCCSVRADLLSMPV